MAVKGCCTGGWGRGRRLQCNCNGGCCNFKMPEFGKMKMFYIHNLYSLIHACHMHTYTYHLHTYSHLYIRNQSKNYLKSNLHFNFAAHKQTKKALSISANFLGWLCIRLPPSYLAHSTHNPPSCTASPFLQTPPTHSVGRIITKFVIKLWQTKKFLEVAVAVVVVVVAVFVGGFMQKLVKNQEEVDSSGAAACTNRPS